MCCRGIALCQLGLHPEQPKLCGAAVQAVPLPAHQVCRVTGGKHRSRQLGPGWQCSSAGGCSCWKFCHCHCRPSPARQLRTRHARHAPAGHPPTHRPTHSLTQHVICLVRGMVHTVQDAETVLPARLARRPRRQRRGEALKQHVVAQAGQSLPPGGDHQAALPLGPRQGIPAGCAGGGSSV
jgi:hypothetical protein